MTHHVRSNTGPFECFSCKSKNCLSYSFKMHYRPKAKYIAKGDKPSNNHLIMIDLCISCNNYLIDYFIEKQNLIDDEIIFSGWDWWDAIDNHYPLWDYIDEKLKKNKKM